MTYTPFLAEYKQVVQTRLNLMIDHLKKGIKKRGHDNRVVIAYATLFKPIAELNNESDENILKSLKNLIYTENKTISKFIFQIQDQKERAALSTEACVRLTSEIQDLSKYVREALYYPGEFTYTAPKQVSDIKSEIRSCKGMVLSRHDFPPAVPLFERIR